MARKTRKRTDRITLKGLKEALNDLQAQAGVEIGLLQKEVARLDTAQFRDIQTIADQRETLKTQQKLIDGLMEVTGGLWKMQDGTLIAIRQMSDSHLRNALRLLGAKTSNPAQAAMLKEQERRRVDREWAARTDPAPTVTDTASGRDIAKLQAEIASLRLELSKLDTFANQRVWDGKLQNWTSVPEQVRRLTRRLFDLEKANRELRKAAPAPDNLAFEDKVPTPKSVELPPHIVSYFKELFGQ